ncbi:MAG: ABC transporter permease [Halanaerobiales bacterium]|nr:ABC transporter permease [Halanaerobiales bacterium]
MLYSLLKNEVYKLLKKKKIYIFMIIITGMTLIPIIVSKFDGGGIVFKVNILPLENLAWSTEMIIPIFISILVADMITNEYSEGTMKINLVNGVSRTELLFSKVLTIILVITGLVLFTMVVSYVSGSFFLEWGIPFEFNDLLLSEGSGILYTSLLYLLSVIPLTAFSLIIIFLGLKLESGGSLVGVSIGIIFIMNTMRQLSSVFRPFIISDYFNTGYLLTSLGIQNGLAIFILTSGIYFIVFMGLSVNHLLKKDIVK